MPRHLAWSRADSVVAGAGTSVYLPFDVPPLPAGSFIRATVTIGATGASDVFALGFTGDWLVSPPLPTAMAVSINPGAGQVPFVLTLIVTVRTRNSLAWGVSAGTVGSGGNSPDWGKSNRLAFYVARTTGITVDAAFVDVYVARVYR